VTEIGKIVFGNHTLRAVPFVKSPTPKPLTLTSFESLLNQEIARLSNQVLEAGDWDKLEPLLGKEPISDNPEVLRARVLELIYFRNIIKGLVK
jgi:hypothetical protein